MFREPSFSKDVGKVAKIRIQQVADKVAEKVVDENQSDEEFLSNLHNLGLINQMADSYGD